MDKWGDLWKAVKYDARSIDVPQYSKDKHYAQMSVVTVDSMRLLLLLDAVEKAEKDKPKCLCHQGSGMYKSAVICPIHNSKPQNIVEEIRAHLAWRNPEDIHTGYTENLRAALVETVETLSECHRTKTTLPIEQSLICLESILDILRREETRDIPKP